MDKCKNIKESILEYIYNELEAPAKAVFEAHLKECPACGKLVASYSKVKDAYMQPQVKLTDMAWTRQLNGIKAKLAEKELTLIEKVRAFLTVKKLAYAMAIMLLVAGAGTGIYTSEKTRTQDKTIAEKMEMLENLDVIERLDFYKQVSESGFNGDKINKIDKKESPVMSIFLKGFGC